MAKELRLVQISLDDQESAMVTTFASIGAAMVLTQLHRNDGNLEKSAKAKAAAIEMTRCAMAEFRSGVYNHVTWNQLIDRMERLTRAAFPNSEHRIFDLRAKP